MRFILALVFSTLLIAQQKGGNNLIRPLADLEKDLKGKLERIKVHGKSLEGNLEGDSADRDVFVYLPPSYQREPNRRYPVVYTLHGYGLHAEQWVGFANFASLEKDVAAGTAKEMILVSPDAFSLHNGSFYSNSQTTGDWETFSGSGAGRIHRQPLPHPGQSSQPRFGGAFDGRLWNVSHRHEAPGGVLQPLFDVGLLHAGHGRSHSGDDSVGGDHQDQRRCREGALCAEVAAGPGRRLVGRSEKPSALFRFAGEGRQAAAGDRREVDGQFADGDAGAVRPQLEKDEGDSR